MAQEEQLDWERRWAKPAGAAAILAALLFLAGTLIYPVSTGQQPATTAEALVRIDENPADALIPAILQALAYLLSILPLVYLYRATKARRKQLLTAAQPLAIVGPILTAVAFITHQVLVVGAARDFVEARPPLGIANPGAGLPGFAGTQAVAEERAVDLVTDATASPLLIGLQYGGLLAVAFALVLISLNAMRAGLLSRFMGFVGIIIGALTVLPLFGPQVVQIFWFAAIGVLILNRWPNGRGPAWEAGEAIPWPTAMDRQRELDEQAVGGADDDVDDEPDGVEDDGPAPGPNGSGPREHPVSKKRKRKRR